uniref:Kallikrein related peptidase 7 n=1 Tax=Pipistrellus kuhlii TaxID=59472 RepID=A0A7J7R1N0_PIPKU|nr:kallikrein related peptidase 7 [Pipistrellus kuhlii]
MAGPLLQALLLLLLSFALGSDGKAAQGNGERILNGVECPRGTHPWQVVLFHNNTFLCAGVLINQRWVLTVAHCRKSDYLVQMGSDHLNIGTVQQIWATESFVHPQYDNRTYDHDLMLVKLSSPAKLSPNVRTIKLPTSCKFPGASCTVSGWGVTSMDVAPTFPLMLMCANANIISYKDCRKVYPVLLKKYIICAAPPVGLAYPCRADLGSPLMCEGSLQGLVSSGYYPCKPPFEPVIYTRLCMYRKWIIRTMKTNS